jgi:hypothetical protein
VPSSDRDRRGAHVLGANADADVDQTAVADGVQVVGLLVRVQTGRNMILQLYQELGPGVPA